MKYHICILFVFVFISSKTKAQWDTLQYDDGTSKLIKVVASEGDEMPTFFIGFRGYAQGYAMKIWPRICMLRVFYGYGLLEKDFFYGSDGILYLFRRKALNNDITVKIGHSVPLELNTYKSYYASVANTTTQQAFGLHFGYKHKQYRDNIYVGVFGSNGHSIFYLQDASAFELYGGIGITCRKGLIVAELSNTLTEEGVPDLESFSSKWLMWMAYADIIIDRGIGYTVQTNWTNNYAWDNSYSPFPKVGWRVAGDIYWNYARAKRSHNFISISGHIGMQNTAVAFLRDPVKEHGFIFYCTGGIFYSIRFKKYNEHSMKKPNKIHAETRK